MARTMAQVIADEEAAAQQHGGVRDIVTGFREPLNAGIQTTRTFATLEQVQANNKKLITEEERALELALEILRRRRAAESSEEPSA